MRKNLIFTAIACAFFIVHPFPAALADDAGGPPAGDKPARERDRGGRPDEARSLTDEQTALVKSILSRYDASSLTKADARAIHNAFREAGIRKGPGMRNAVTAAGFDPDRLRALDPPPDKSGAGAPRAAKGWSGGAPADASGRPDPNTRGKNPNGGDRPHEALSLADNQVAMVKSILAKYDASSLTAADAKAIHKAFREAGIRKGPGMRDAVMAAGFDPAKLRSLDPPPQKK